MSEILSESNNVLRAELERLEVEWHRLTDPLAARILVLRQLLGLDQPFATIDRPGMGSFREVVADRKKARAAHPVPTPEAPDGKREIARKLALAGKSLDAIAVAIGVSRVLARAHVNALKRQGKLPADLPGLGLTKQVTITDAPNAKPRKPPPAPSRPREDLVLELARDGKKAKAIAEDLDISLQTVYVHLASLRRQGKLPPVEREAPPPFAPTGRHTQTTSTPTDAPKEAPRPAQAAPPPVSPPSQPTNAAPANAAQQTPSAIQGDPAGIVALRFEAARQCRENKTPAGPVLLMTTLAGNKNVRRHAHRAKLDRIGEGVTQPDETGHQHRVFRFVVQELDHGHALTMP